MNFAFSPEQEEIRATLRGFIETHMPLAETRRVMTGAHGFDRGAWQALSDELGLLGLTIPERFGGAGLGAVELTAVMEELGRALVSVPFFSTVALAATALRELGSDSAQARWLPGIASGELVATLAITESSARWDANGIRMSACPRGDAAVLEGTKEFVTDGASAGLILVVARQDDGFGVFAVDAASPGMSRETLPVLDPTRPLARIHFDAVEAEAIGPVAGWPEIQTVLDLACVALTAEQIGAADRALEMATDHARVREQFGRPIGSFQAIKHKCADMLLRVEAARAAAYYAGWTAEADRESLRRVTSIAKADVSEAFLHVAEENLQIHGGLGFTWEQDPHLYLKRARSTHVLLGDPAYHRSLSAAALLD